MCWDSVVIKQQLRIIECNVTTTSRTPRTSSLQITHSRHHVETTAERRVHRDGKLPNAQTAIELEPFSEPRRAQDTGNKVARKATLVGTQNIMLGGKTVIQPEVMIRGDLIRTIQASSQSASGAAPNNTAVSIGRYCFLSRGSCLRPPGRLYKGYVFYSLGRESGLQAC
jgi:hypothetical protein